MRMQVAMALAQSASTPPCCAMRWLRCSATSACGPLCQCVCLGAGPAWPMHYQIWRRPKRPQSVLGHDFGLGHRQDQAERHDAVTKAVELIVGGLKSDNANLRQGAAKALLDLNAPRETVGPPLMAALDAAYPEVQENVAQALASQGEAILPRHRTTQRPGQSGTVLRVFSRMGCPRSRAPCPRCWSCWVKPGRRGAATSFCAGASDRPRPKPRRH